jgi:deoxyadenosine/deoxycytidine kinase
MKIPDYKKLGIYCITLLLMIEGLIGIIETPNDNYFLEGFYLLMFMPSVIIQIIFLCSKDSESTTEAKQ